MRIIAISGYAGHGKDTVAQMMYDRLTELGNSVLIAHYADLVKYICGTFFDWDGEKDVYGRHLLQYIGTDVVRSRDPDYWVRFIADMMDFFGDNWDFVLIPDTRFPNEITKLREAGYTVDHLRVVRPNYDGVLTEEQKRHPSETALDGVDPDHVILNGGSLTDLREAVADYIKENIYGN